jgi:hypothetical protein
MIICLNHNHHNKSVFYPETFPEMTSFKKMSSLRQLAVIEPEPNRISIVQECDARMFNSSN